ncbi:helix-turn-helix domain-containing protein, partial [Streptomyces sp. TRM76130]|nr:helix-turn-helix domain-containing protein [Streptomyces sp. TRM76130]
MSIGNSPGNSPDDERPFEDMSDDVPEEARPSIGHLLRQARIAAGLTVDDISSATRVRIAIVHAIEADDFAPCGGDVYARGHIRTLARAVG